MISNPVENESLCCTVVLPFGIILAKVQPCFASTISWKWTNKVSDRHWVVTLQTLQKLHWPEFKLELLFGHSDNNEYFTNLSHFLTFWWIRILEEFLRNLWRIFKESLRNSHCGIVFFKYFRIPLPPTSPTKMQWNEEVGADGRSPVRILSEELLVAEFLKNCKWISKQFQSHLVSPVRIPQAFWREFWLLKNSCSTSFIEILCTGSKI